MELLSCGHPPTPQTVAALIDGGGTGVCFDATTKEAYCYACAAKRERASMIATGRATLYLVAPKEGRKNYAVTNWSGMLSFVAFNFRHSRNGGGFGCQRSDADFVGPDGYVWHAVNRGDMQLARCKRTKRKAAPGILGVAP